MEQFGLVYKTIPFFICLQKRLQDHYLSLYIEYVISLSCYSKLTYCHKIFHFAFDVLYAPKPANCILTVFYFCPYCCIHHHFELNLAKFYDPIHRASPQSLADAIWLSALLRLLLISSLFIKYKLFTLSLYVKAHNV